MDHSSLSFVFNFCCSLSLFISFRFLPVPSVSISRGPGSHRCLRRPGRDPLGTGLAKDPQRENHAPGPPEVGLARLRHPGERDEEKETKRKKIEVDNLFCARIWVILPPWRTQQWSMFSSLTIHERSPVATADSYRAVAGRVCIVTRDDMPSRLSRESSCLV